LKILRFKIVPIKKDLATEEKLLAYSIFQLSRCHRLANRRMKQQGWQWLI